MLRSRPMPMRPTLAVTTLEELDEMKGREARAMTAAERFAAVETLREAYYNLHGREQTGVARTLAVADFPPPERPFRHPSRG